jgi:CubicO group peptidase (beta-lactamase class C family)
MRLAIAIAHPRPSPRAQPLAHPVGEYWSYSSDTANILSRIVQDAAGPLAAAYPAEALFKPLGMTSAVTILPGNV